LSPVQTTTRLVTHPTNPAEDKKANSNAVPNIYAISTQFQRVILLRFKYDPDLWAGLESMVKQQGIRNAVILAGMRSIRNYQVHA